MVRKKEEKWISAQEATRILSEKAERTIDRTYIGSLVRAGKVEVRQVDGRTNEYRASDVENYMVKPRSKKKTAKAEPPSTEGGSSIGQADGHIPTKEQTVSSNPTKAR